MEPRKFNKNFISQSNFLKILLSYAADVLVTCNVKAPKFVLTNSEAFRIDHSQPIEKPRKAMTVKGIVSRAIEVRIFF
jgi:hypothetical protein